MAPGQEQACLSYMDVPLDWSFIQESPVVSDQSLSFEDTSRSVDNLLATLPSQQPNKVSSLTMLDSPPVVQSDLLNQTDDISDRFGFGIPVGPIDPTAASVSAGPLTCDLSCQLPCCIHGQPYSPSALSFNPTEFSPSDPHSPLSVADSIPCYQTSMPMFDSNSRSLSDENRSSSQMMVVPHVSIAFSPPQGPLMGDHSIDQLSLTPTLNGLFNTSQQQNDDLAFSGSTGRARSKSSSKSRSGLYQNSAGGKSAPSVLGKRNSISKGRSRQSPKPDKSSRRFCHICRSAKELSKIVACCSGKQSHVFCSSCVVRRLDLSFEELVQRDDWLCPKCLDECPCSKCRPRIRD